LFLTFINFCSTKRNAKILVDKIPNFFIANALNLFPEAKIIHIMRDGREVCASAVKRGDWADSLVNIVVFWQESLRQYRMYYKKFNKNNFFDLKYENLVENPNESIREIFKFLELEIKSDDFFDKVNKLKPRSSFDKKKEKGIYFSKNFDKYFNEKEKRDVCSIIKRDLLNYDYINKDSDCIQQKKDFNLFINTAYERLKINLHFWFKKKGYYWIYSKFRKYFK